MGIAYAPHRQMVLMVSIIKMYLYMYHCELNVIEDCWIEYLGRSLVGRFSLTFWSDKLTALSEVWEKGRGRRVGAGTEKGRTIADFVHNP